MKEKITYGPLRQNGPISKFARYFIGANCVVTGCALYSRRQEESDYFSDLGVTKSENPSESFRMSLFDTQSRVYDEIAKNRDNDLKLTRVKNDALKRISGHCLEVHSGSASFLLKNPSTHIKSINLTDLSPGMLNALSEKIDASQYEGGVPIIVSKNDSRKLCFDDNVFDTVISFFGLSSSEDPEATMNELCRVVNENGKIILCELTQNKELLGLKTSQSAWKNGIYRYRNIKTLIENANVEVKKMEYHNFGFVIFAVLQPRKGREGIQSLKQQQTIEKNNDTNIIHNSIRVQQQLKILEQFRIPLPKERGDIANIFIPLRPKEIQ